MSNKTEALSAIEHVRNQIANQPGPLLLNERLLIATLDHAHSNVEAIVEVKRVRKPKTEPVWPGLDKGATA